MTVQEPSPAAPSLSRHRVRRSRARLWQAFLRFLTNWHVEIIVLLLLGAGIFLLLDPGVRHLLLGGLSSGMRALANLGSGAIHAVASGIFTSRPADLAGYALVALALLLVLYRVRWRLMRSPRLSGRQCPRCGGSVHRIHRRWIDRVVSVVLPVRRYSCRDHDCGWRGLRVGHSHDE